MTGKRRKGRPIGETIGGIIVGFDQQIFRTTPPAEELVAKGRPVRGLSGEDGSGLRVVFPGEEGSEEPPEPGQTPEQGQPPEQGDSPAAGQPPEPGQPRVQGEPPEQGEPSV